MSEIHFPTLEDIDEMLDGEHVLRMEGKSHVLFFGV